MLPLWPRMPKTNKIPVYDICSISPDADPAQDFLAERLSVYLEKYYQQLHFPHRHSFYHLVLFTSGKGYHTIDFDRFEVKAAQVYFMAPGQVHGWHFAGKMEGYIINFSDSFFKSFLNNPAYLDRFGFLSGNSRDGVVQLTPHQQKEAVEIFDVILSQTARTDRDMLRVLLLQLLLLVDQSIDKKDNQVPRQKQVLLNGFRKLIEANYKTLHLPKEYADMLYVTPNHLNALCQDLLGKTAGELIRDRVLLEAKRLLTNAGLTITEIAYELNFQDNSYFNRFFKKYTGSTPDQFRKQFQH